MVHFTIPGLALKRFTKAMTCLSRFGTDVVFAVDEKKGLECSARNSTVSAFGKIDFEPSFFGEFVCGHGTRVFQVTSKALLVPFRTLGAPGAVTTCDIRLVEGDESRLVIRLRCLHGVTKTHCLTFNAFDGQPIRTLPENIGRLSTWSATSRVLRDWLDHFHQHSGPDGDEITFYCLREAFKLRNFSGAFGVSKGDSLASKPVATELVVDTSDCEEYRILEDTAITFVLKEFRAILALAEAFDATVTTFFSYGGEPFYISFEEKDLCARFVIATSDYDDAQEDAQIPGQESSRSESARPPSFTPRATSVPCNPPPEKANLKTEGSDIPLFLPTTQEEQERSHTIKNESDDEFEELAFNEDDFASIDRLSQAPPRSTAHEDASVEDNNEEPETMRDDITFDDDDDGGLPPALLGPTQDVRYQSHPRKKPRWNLFPE